MKIVGQERRIRRTIFGFHVKVISKDLTTAVGNSLNTPWYPWGNTQSGVLEAYGITSCDQLPNGDDVFYSPTLYLMPGNSGSTVQCGPDSPGNYANLWNAEYSWAANGFPSCSYDLSLFSDGEVFMYY
jgi:hypothetical protein